MMTTESVTSISGVPMAVDLASGTDQTIVTAAGKPITNAELVAEYNRLSGKTIKRFSSRAAGLKALAALRPKVVKPAKRTKEQSAEARSRSAKGSWANAATAKERAKRTGVNVYFAKGHRQFVGEYRSVAEAFTDLKLPMGVHIRFRAKVKKEGHAKIEGKQDVYQFCARCAAGACKFRT